MQRGGGGARGGVVKGDEEANRYISEAKRWFPIFRIGVPGFLSVSASI